MYYGVTIFLLLWKRVSESISAVTVFIYVNLKNKLAFGDSGDTIEQICVQKSMQIKLKS